MTREQNAHFYDQNDLDDSQYTGRLPYIKNIPREEQSSPSRKKSKEKSKPSDKHILAELEEQADDVSTFEFTYKASRHESVWLADSLG
ncbi:MAG: hypothetical protein PVI99_08515, partial [Anaerolineales bacterium]